MLAMLTAAIVLVAAVPAVVACTIADLRDQARDTATATRIRGAS